MAAFIHGRLQRPARRPGTEQDAAKGRQAAEPAPADLDQAREAAERQARQDARRNQAEAELHRAHADPGQAAGRVAPA